MVLLGQTRVRQPSFQIDNVGCGHSNDPRPGDVVDKLAQRDDALMIREVEGEYIVLDTLTNQVHQFNRTASFIWRRIQDASDTRQIAQALAAEFEVDEQTALSDVSSILTTMRALKLIADERQP